MCRRGRAFLIKVRPLFLFFLLLFFPTIGFTSDVDHYIQKANELNLAQDKLWKDLLHFKGNRSQILSDSFFLSDHGKVDSQAELEATIAAYFTQEYDLKREHGDENIVCIFPARYMWLNSKLNLPGYKNDETLCPVLHEWARLNEIEDVSVVYVGNYLGNPASSFGHLMLNLKVKGQEGLSGLFDTSVSFGAEVPANENMALYILKGLFGGYYSSFTDKFFYTHDQVYSNREFRDMWEYTLALSDVEKTMLIYHLAELLSQRYRYFFFSANCAQRIAVVLDIFIKEDLYNFNYPIYIPEELLHRLQKIDERRRENDDGEMIKSVEFIPSAQRTLYYETKRLNDEERNVYRDITNNPDGDLGEQLKDLDQEERIHALNALLAYQYYTIMSTTDEKADHQLKEFKNRILLERLSLPAKKEEPLEIPTKVLPTEMAPPFSFNTGFVVEESGASFATLGATVFRKESVGLNTLEYNDIVALDLNLGIDVDDTVFVDRFDALDIRDFKTLYIEEANESPFSWRLRLGMDRYDAEDKSLYDYVADGGGGMVKTLGEMGIVYGFANVSVHSLDQQYRAGPSVGFVLGQDVLKFQLDYGVEFGLESEEYLDKAEAKVQYQLNREHALQLFFEKNERSRLGVNYIYYW